MKRNKTIKMVFRMMTLFVPCFIIGMLSTNILAAEYPTKPITIILPYPPGGGIDIPGRAVADYFSKRWEKPINIVNKPGGNTVPATLEVYQAKPDGYTLYIDSSGSSSLQVATVKNLPFKLEDRTFLAKAVFIPMVCLTHVEKPWRTLKDVSEYAKKDPGNFKWAAVGTASVSTFAAGQFLEVAGVDISATKQVTFKGGPDAATALAGGFVDFYIFGLAPSMAFVQAGKLRHLAVISPNRLEKIPDVPTSKESGFPGLTASAWIGITGPPNLPREVIEKWNEGMKQASKDPEFISKTRAAGNEVEYLPPEEFRKMVLEEAKNFTGLSKKMGISQ